MLVFTLFNKINFIFKPENSLSRKIYVDDEKNEVVEKAKTVEKIFGYEVSIIINKNLSLDFSVKKNYF